MSRGGSTGRIVTICFGEVVTTSQGPSLNFQLEVSGHEKWVTSINWAIKHHIILGWIRSLPVHPFFIF